MKRESLPLLIVLILPLAGAAGLLPGPQAAEGRDAAVVAAAPLFSPLAEGMITPIRLVPPESPSPGPAVAGVWLNF